MKIFKGDLEFGEIILDTDTLSKEEKWQLDASTFAPNARQYLVEVNTKNFKGWTYPYDTGDEYGEPSWIDKFLIQHGGRDSSKEFWFINKCNMDPFRLDNKTMETE